MNFEVSGFESESYGPEIKRFSIKYDDYLLVADPIKPLKVDGNMKFRLKPDFEIVIIIYYKASFGNSGTADYNIIVKNGKIYFEQNK